MKIDIGMSEKERKDVAKILEKFLADTYALYLKTQNFHWNLTGPQFIAVHVMLQKQYEDMAEAVDEVAERIRSLGFYAVGSFSSFKKLTSISDENEPIGWKEMIKKLVKGHEYIAKEYRPAIHESQNLHDEMTGDMLIKRIAFHEKAAWMLRSHLSS